MNDSRNVNDFFQRNISEEKYRHLFEASRDALYIASKEGRFIEMNPAGIKMFGFAKEEITGLDVHKIYNDPADREKIQRAMEEQGYIRDYEITLVKKDRTKMDCLLTSTLWRAEDGSIMGYQGVIREISSQKRMIEHLQQSQKMEAIGTLAGGIAHNFNNLLMTIQGNISLILMKSNPADPNYKKLKTIEQHIQYGAELSKQLLSFARGSQHQLRRVDINGLIRMGAKMFTTTRKEITINTKFEDMLWLVEADPAQLEQVMLNMFVNAWQAMPGGGEINIRTENIVLGDQEIPLFQAAPGRYIKISITDTGVGMDEKTKQKIFEPFFTTREQGLGAGLGLSTVYSIIKNHHGYITVYSQPLKGTTFNIYLPASAEKSEKAPPQRTPLLRGKETILIVEDEKRILDIATAMLTELGYKVMTADSGIEALIIYRSNMEEIDLILLDLIMPKMNGAETYKRLKEINPDIKVLVSSGYTLDENTAKLLDSGCSGFIQKPYDLMELSQKVREVIDIHDVGKQ